MQSDLNRIRDLKQIWYPQKLGEFESRINAAMDDMGFTDDYVLHAITHKSQQERPRTSKVIKDSVWGMVEIDWQSIRVLDCPVVQRLRGVRQLGFSNLTYPSAEHSRFAHSLGMFAVVARFLESMARPDQSSMGENEYKRFEIEKELKLDLLHAALLHDCGHMPFSHASEKLMVARPEDFFCAGSPLSEFMAEPEDKLSKSLQLSELLSLAIILSPRFKKFYSEVVRDGLGDADRADRVATLIAGLRPEPKLRGIAELISNSAVDADKVDYINRDALACGIPVGIDEARLFLRSAFLEVKAEQIAKLTREKLPAQDEVIFVVNASGVDTMEELASARASLYQRVYLHQTTRSAERLLARSMECLPTDDPMRDAMYLLASDDSRLLRDLLSHKSIDVVKPAKMIRDRELPKRACAFGRTLVDLRMPVDQILKGVAKDAIAKQSMGSSIETLRHVSLKGAMLLALETAIAKEAVELAKQVYPIANTLVPGPGLTPFVTVLPMTELDGLSQDCIVRESNELVHSSRRTIADEQIDAARIYKSLGYVMTDPIWRNCVFLASRKVIALSTAQNSPKPIDVKVGDTSLQISGAGSAIIDRHASARRSSLDLRQLAEVEEKAALAGYFDDAPWLLQADPGASTQIAMRFGKFDGQFQWSVTPASALAFLSQFPPSLRQEVSELLIGQFIYIDRATIRNSFKELIGNYQKTVNAKVWVVGLTPDSGAHVRTMMEQELKTSFSENEVSIEKGLEQVLDTISPGQAILFCDDNISSGSQAQSQFRAWFGVPRDKWPEQDQAEGGIFDLILSPGHQAKLRNARIALGYCVGSANAEAGVRQTLQDLGAKNFDGLKIKSPLNRGDSVSPKLHEFLRTVGINVLAYARYGSVNGLNGLDQDQSKAFRVDDACGYSDARALVATGYSVPTGTYPAFWCPGFHMGVPWMPLLVRRGYVSKFVVS